MVLENQENQTFNNGSIRIAGGAHVKKNYYGLCIFFLISFHLYLLSQISFTVWPEMMLMPYLMKNGFELYRDMIVPWTPGLLWVLRGWFWLTGLTVWNLKILTWIIIVSADMLIYFIAAKRWGKTAGVIALIIFLLLQPLFDGNGLWFDVAVVPLLLLAFHFDNPLFLGPAFLIKQSVVWLFPLCWRQWKRLAVGIVGAITASGIWFWSRGELGDYWFWVYDFTFRIFPGMPGHLDLATWRHWVLALIPFVIVFSYRFLKTKTLRWLIDPSDPAAWAIFSIPFTLPRFGFFHFQPAIAFLALGIGSLYKDYKSYKTYLLLGAVLVYLGLSWYRIIQLQWEKPDRFLEQGVYQLAAKVRLETDSQKPLLLVNGPELVYVLADRLPPKPWFTQFPWFLELPGFQERMIKEFQKQDLQQVFFTPYLHEGDFMPGSYKPTKLLEYLRTVSNHSND